MVPEESCCSAAVIARAKAWHKAHPLTPAQHAAKKASGAVWRAANKRKIKSDNLLRRYGITLDQRDKMLDAQDGRCKICRVDKPGSSDWAVDHDHETGQVRGILCHRCNLCLGWLGETASIVEQRMRAIRECMGAEETYVDGRLVPWEPKK